MNVGKRRGSVAHRTQGGVAFVSLSGTIDESFPVDEIKQTLVALGGAPVVFDFDGVELITSFGVRQWLEVLRALQGPSYFIRCRPPVVAQANSVETFVGRSAIVTFYCPYLCAACDEAFDVLLDVRKDREAIQQSKAPPASCPTCGAAAEFDDLEDIYFSRVKRQPPLELPPLVDQALGGAAPLAFRKTVHGNTNVLTIAGALRSSGRLRRYVAGLEGNVVVNLQRLQSASEESLRDLLAILTRDKEPIYFARVPMPIVSMLVPLLAEVGAIVSTVVSAQCRACGGTLADNIIVPAGAGSEALWCPRCNARGLDVDAVTAVTLASLPPVSGAPGEIADALRVADEEAALHDENEGSKLLTTTARGSRLGKYEIVDRIGVGGMAEVLAAKSIGVEGFEKKVVIKRILPHLAQREQFVRMFLNEARIASKLSDSHIVQILDLVQEQNEFFMVMEYVHGLDLQQVLRILTNLGESMPLPMCARIAADICAGLAAAHEYVDEKGPNAIFHRDVSPHNVMVGNDGQVKLTDFGIAKAMNSEDHTRTGVLKGKAMYMAPEVVAGAPYDARADVFALGLCLYTMVGLRHPFREANEVRALDAVLRAPIPPITTVRPDCPDALADIVMRAVQRDPMRRYQRARDVMVELEAWLAATASPATPAKLALWLGGLRARFVERDANELVRRSEFDQTVTTPRVKTDKLTPADE